MKVCSSNKKYTAKKRTTQIKLVCLLFKPWFKSSFWKITSVQNQLPIAFGTALLDNMIEKNNPPHTH